MPIGRVVFAFAALAGVTMTYAVPARAALLITVDKSSQMMTVEVDGSTRYVWPVSTGVSGYDTPSGQFKPFRMEADHFSKEWDDAPMPHSIFFTMQGHAIHGSSHIKAIGTPASHGCVRLEPKNAAVLFDLVKQQKMANTRVVLTGELPLARGAPVARQNQDDDRTYRRTYTNDNYGRRDTYGRIFGNNDADFTATVPQRRARQGRIIRDEYGRQFLVYDDVPPRTTYGRDGGYYAAPRRYDGQQPYGWPYGGR